MVCGRGLMDEVAGVRSAVRAKSKGEVEGSVTKPPELSTLNSPGLQNQTSAGDWRIQHVLFSTITKSSSKVPYF